MLEGHVTLAITRVPKFGREREWEDLVVAIQRTAQGSPGSLGITVLKPVSTGQRAYQIIVRFDSLASFRRWESSPERRHFLKRLQSLESEPVKIEQAIGLETWFELPGGPALRSPPLPPRYKMMVVTGIGVYLTITPLLFFLGPFLNRVPVYAGTLVVVPVMVLLLSYVTMPVINRLLRRWLYGS